MQQLGKRENRARAAECIGRIQDQKKRTEELMKQFGVQIEHLGGSKVKGFEEAAKAKL